MPIFRFLPSVCLFIWLTLSVFSCTHRGQSSLKMERTEVDSVSVTYARGFTIEKYGDISLVTVSNPWQGAKDVSYHYVLCPKGAKVPEALATYPVVYTPVERVICLSTTHVAMLSALGKTASIKAMSGTSYVSDSIARQLIADGKIIDIGYDQALNYEQIISLKADVIFAYGVGEEVVGNLARLTDLGQKVVFNAEYLEQTALGKAEWLKFMAAFFDEEEQASQQFKEIEEEYNALCTLVKDAPNHPAVLCGLPWQGVWYIPGGKTSMAAMIADAGGKYLWKENDSHESLPIHIEAIIHKAGLADLWINTGAARTLSEIKSVDDRLRHLKSYQTGMIYNNYARISAGGGNDFFESGIVRPQLILKDMIKMFHPNLLPNHQLYYYMKLTDE